MAANAPAPSKRPILVGDPRANRTKQPLGSLAFLCVTFLVSSSWPQKAGVPLLLYLGHRRIS